MHEAPGTLAWVIERLRTAFASNYALPEWLPCDSASAKRRYLDASDLGAAFSHRAELHSWLTHVDEDHYDGVVLLDCPHHSEWVALAPSPAPFIRWTSDDSAHCLIVEFEADDYGGIRYTPSEPKQTSPRDRADWTELSAVIPGCCNGGHVAVVEWIRAFVITLIGILNDVIAVGLHLARAIRPFQTLISIERQWFLYHGGHPPKTQAQAFRGLYSLGMCSSPLAA